MLSWLFGSWYTVDLLEFTSIESVVDVVVDVARGAAMLLVELRVDTLSVILTF
jgi:hypothetical protein